MMELNQEFRFVCKLCNKKYPCGKSLGGHMRSHVVANSAESEENMKRIASFAVNDPKVATEFSNGQSSYVLRENPRKTWRAVDAKFPLPQEKICKQCGKGFQSLKALCGHMACHSERDRGLKDDHSWTSENQKLVMDSHSDTEAEDRILCTRSSKSKRNKKVAVNNAVSSVSEIDGEEQEEVAMCLMLLSRDSGSGVKGGVNSVVESSDNNSVILETKSSSIDMRSGKMDALKNVDSLEEIPRAKNIKESKMRVWEAEMENSDSGYFLDECANAESEVSIGGIRRSFALGEYDKPPLMNWRSDNRRTSYGTDANNVLLKESEYDNSGTAWNPSVVETRNRRYVSEEKELYDEYCRSMIDDEMYKVSEKSSKYECFNCKKTFKSYQALGGHRPCHKRSNAYYESRYESGENSPDDSAEFITCASNRKSSAKKLHDKKNKAKKNKCHACPFCSRVFKNGQALGGHKRSHFLGGHDGNSNRNPIVKPDLLDLNLPAPKDDEDDRNDPFSGW